LFSEWSISPNKNPAVKAERPPKKRKRPSKGAACGKETGESTKATSMKIEKQSPVNTSHPIPAIQTKSLATAPTPTKKASISSIPAHLLEERELPAPAVSLMPFSSRFLSLPFLPAQANLAGDPSCHEQLRQQYLESLKLRQAQQLRARVSTVDKMTVHHGIHRPSPAGLRAAAVAAAGVGGQSWDGAYTPQQIHYLQYGTNKPQVLPQVPQQVPQQQVYQLPGRYYSQPDLLSTSPVYAFPSQYAQQMQQQQMAFPQHLAASNNTQQPAANGGAISVSHVSKPGFEADVASPQQPMAQPVRRTSFSITAEHTEVLPPGAASAPPGSSGQFFSCIQELLKATQDMKPSSVTMKGEVVLEGGTQAPMGRASFSISTEHTTTTAPGGSFSQNQQQQQQQPQQQQQQQQQPLPQFPFGMSSFSTTSSFGAFLGEPDAFMPLDDRRLSSNWDFTATFEERPSFSAVAAMLPQQNLMSFP